MANLFDIASDTRMTTGGEEVRMSAITRMGGEGEWEFYQCGYCLDAPDWMSAGAMANWTGWTYTEWVERA